MKFTSSGMRWFLNLLGRSTIAAIGTALTTGSGLLLLAIIAIDLTGGLTNPYLGILFFGVLPALFVLGLLLIPLGAWLSRRSMPATPVVSALEDHGVRKGLLLVGVATVANVVILGTASYRAVELMDTREFCGQTCHSVMEPEARAATSAPHAHVRCVACHVGPGASGFLHAKVNGLSQLTRLVTGTYRKPIPVPIEGHSPARSLCLDCHALARVPKEKLKIVEAFAPDEHNTPSVSVLMLKVGPHAAGPGAGIGVSRGIHWHVAKDAVVEYQATDAQRTTITRVRVRDAKGVREFTTASSSSSGAPSGAPSGEFHTMDCVDCHNRPAHTLELPERALDAAIASGRIDRGLPWIKKNGLTLLKATYNSKAHALASIDHELGELYPSGPEASVAAAAAAIREIYDRNIFPQMAIGWGTYPNHIGHTDSPGCFRCHDGAHKDAAGNAIPDDCATCHAVIAMEEENPAVLTTLFPPPE